MKYIVLLYCCCLLSGTALAQQMIGVRGGYTLSSMQLNRSPAPAQEWVPGFSGGLVFRTLNTPHLGLQLELLLEQKGWHIFPGTEEEYGIREQHLTLPVQSVVMLGSGRFQLVVSGGAYVSYVLKEEKREDGSSQLGYETQPRQDWQYGLLGGVGPAMKIGRNWLQLEGRFAFTLSNRLEPDLGNRNTLNVSQQQTVTIALVWLNSFGNK